MWKPSSQEEEKDTDTEGRLLSQRLCPPHLAMEADPEKLSPGQGPRPAELAWSWAALPQAGEPAAAVLPWTAHFLCSCWCGSGRVVSRRRSGCGQPRNTPCAWPFRAACWRHGAGRGPFLLGAKQR